MLEEIEHIIKEALLKLPGTDPEKLEIIPTRDPNFGDYQTNVAMQHSKILKKNPLEIAKNIVTAIKGESLPFRAEVVKPGFINLFLENDYLSEKLQKIASDPKHLGVKQVQESRPCVIDYSSPNVAKTMHVAHLRSTIIGDSIKRILAACGYQVIADNHLGDWGTQFGKLLYAYKNFDADYGVAKESVEFLEKLYQDFVKRAKEDDSLNDCARQETASLQRKEEPNYSLWQQFISISLREFEQVYQRLDIQFDHQYGESHYNDDLSGVVKTLQDRGICKESEGAQVIFFENEEYPPVPVQKGDGGFLYSTTDIATVAFRVREFDPSKIVYITDNRQKLHFQQFFRVSELLGYQTDLVHIPFGLMKFGAGTIMSTKEGQVISLKDFLDEAEKRAYEVLKETNYTQEEKREIARVVGIAAVKYQDLSQNPGSDITFTWEKALNLEGNSAPYLLYAYARVQSIYRKYKDSFGELPSEVDFQWNHELEKSVALQILQFPRAVEHAVSFYRPNIIADYIYVLASKFASLYNQLSIMKEENIQARESRMKLALLSSQVIKKGLGLLGIETLDRM